MDFPNSVFNKAFLQATIFHGALTQNITSHFIAKTSKYTESRDKAVLVTVPWPPGSSLSPPELLESCLTSFAVSICLFLAWVLTSLILGV